MKIVLVNTVYATGSVGRICADLYEVLEKQGDTPYAATGRGMLPEGVRGCTIGNKIDFFCHVLKNFTQGKSGFGSQKVTQKFLRWLDEIRPDAIHLHNIHGFYLQTELLFAYLKERQIPVIWTLHDCWPFTGHCAYFDYVSCTRWKEGGCHDCSIHAKAYPYAIFKDNTIWNFQAKKQAYTGVDRLTIVTPSRWLAGLVKQSFLGEYPVRVIPNGIDLARFSPAPKAAESTECGAAPETVQKTDRNGAAPEAVQKTDRNGAAPETVQKTDRNSAAPEAGKRIVLGVANCWEERKGLRYFMQLAEVLPPEYEIQLVGLSASQCRNIRKHYPAGRIRPMMRTQSVEELAELYRKADVFVNATLEDNFPTTNLEALACGTPVITFDTGGSAESLDDTCGIAVPKGDVGKLREAVLFVCGKHPIAPEDCRKRALLFDRGDRYMEYVSLYREMIGERKDD